MKRNLSDDAIGATISGWNKLANEISKFSESDLLKAIELEKKGSNRVTILHRLFQRYNKLRGNRELRELLS